jgi:hypothetical protein
MRRVEASEGGLGETSDSVRVGWQLGAGWAMREDMGFLRTYLVAPVLAVLPKRWREMLRVLKKTQAVKIS